MKLAKTLALAAVLLPSAALAQSRPQYEFGVDAALAYTKPDQGDGALTLGAPVDVRIGFLRPAPWNLETRFTFNHVSSDGSSVTIFTPTLNVIYQAGKRAVVQRGLYFTGGLGLNIVRVSGEDPITGDDFSETETDPTVNFGIGTRRSINQAAFRPEGFFAYGLDSETFSVGVRAGLSFWK